MARYVCSGLASALILAGVVLLGCAPSPESVVAAAQPAVAEPPAAAVSDADLKALVEGNNQFAIEIYKKIAETETGNICISPYSIRMAMAMIYAGANGSTSKEMKDTLHLNLQPEKLHSSLGSLNKLFASSSKPNSTQVSIANTVLLRKGFLARPDFLDILSHCYNCSPLYIDFHNVKLACETINNWASQSTKSMIPEVVKAEDLGPDLKMALVNAVFFSGQWRQQFDIANTVQRDFTITENHKVSVPLMTEMGMQMRISEQADFRLLELPYADGRWHLHILLPMKWLSLEATEHSLTYNKYTHSVSSLEPAKRPFAMPRFKMHTSKILTEQLESLGIKSAFQAGKADFSLINYRIAVYINSVVHQTRIEVDEKGTRAAAATVITTKAISASEPILVDSPFCFFVVDKQTGIILFIGRVHNPA